jgi:thiol-disulfide isomerase/thioredoxin
MNLVLLSLLACAGSGSVAATPDPTEAAPRSTQEVKINGIYADKLVAKLQEPGKVRVVNFWATWCDPCREEMPMIRDVAKARSAVELILVDLDHPAQRPRRVLEFIRETELTAFTHYGLDDRDPLKALMQNFKDWPDFIPVTLIVDETGAMKKRFLGGVAKPDLEAVLPPPG